MDMNEYQSLASATEKDINKDQSGMVVALLGLAGETGSLLTLYKKWIRDGDAYQIIKSRIGEELGDILWYIAAIAARADLTMDEVASANIKKVTERWLPSSPADLALYDEQCKPEEQLPRHFTAEFRDSGDSRQQTLELLIDGQKCGSILTDNAYEGDDYRYHDLVHIGFATVLGWSPVFRALLRKKRRSDPLSDQVEDGGRAVAIEEGLSALIFNYARKHSLLDGVSRLDWPLLRTCHEMTSHLEVTTRSLHDWEMAILSTFRVWREIKKNHGGFVVCDLRTREMKYRDSVP
jgi:NTP pyrophosphatase (non-canonical NTP hydrolase)